MQKASPSAACDWDRRSAGLLGCIQFCLQVLAEGNGDMLEMLDLRATDEDVVNHDDAPDCSVK